MKLLKVLLILFAIGAAFFIIGKLFIAPQKTPNTISSVSDLEAHLAQVVEKNIPPGLSILVTKNDAVVYNQSFGYANGPDQLSASSNTVYHWWSMTKIPTAIAMMQLAEQGKIDLDAPVHEYLSYFEVQYPSPASSDITARQLLSHTSGLPDFIPALIGWVHYEDVILDQTELSKQHLPDYNQIEFEPGSDFKYSNHGYLVLSAIIEAVSGQSYETYIADNILTPTGMESTSFLYNESLSDHEALGSQPIFNFFTPLLPFLLDMERLIDQREGAVWWLNRTYIDVTPSTGLLGSTDDVGLLMQAILNSDTLLSKASTNEMLPNDNQPFGRALGWAEFGTEDRLWVQHQGGGPGFATIMRLYPEEGLGIVIMANSTRLDGVALVELLSNLTWE